MADIFISYVDDDADLAVAFASVIEEAGYSTWYHERDSIPGPPYRAQVEQAMNAAAAILVIISNASMDSKQVTYEIVHAHKTEILFIPVLHGVTERELRARRRDWRDCLGDAASINIRPGADGSNAACRGVVAGLKAVGIEPQRGPSSEDTTSRAAVGTTNEVPPTTVDSHSERDDVRSILEKLLDRGNVAEAPDDVEAAIKVGFADLDNALAEIDSRQDKFDLADVDHIIGVAIGHGAGIYNHSHAGRIGCGRIYHRAAEGLLKVAAKRVPSAGEVPLTDVRLAVDWLDRIVQATPSVTPPIADDIAWELRFAFDSIHHIPLCDQVREVLVHACSREDSLQSIASVIGQVVERSKAFGQPHVQAYLLRHTAQLVASQMADQGTAARSIQTARDRLATVVKSHPRIVRENTAGLSGSLLKAFADICASIEVQDRIETTAATKPEVFISAKTEDYKFAEQVYEFLMSHGVPTFFSKVSLPETGSSEYQKQIDHALDACRHMVVVTSSAKNVNSSWVEAEWRLFVNEKRSGRKSGNLVNVVIGGLQPSDLPASLRYYEVIPFDPASLARILPFVGR